jgi:hypothetical protein
VRYRLALANSADLRPNSADLRRFLARGSDASVTCVILAQGAQGAQDPEVLRVVTAAQDTVLRTHRSALTRLKTTAPQVLTGPSSSAC